MTSQREAPADVERPGSPDRPVFGKRDSCLVPSPDLEERFLE